MKRLARIDGDLISSGLHPSLPHSQIPLWVSGANVAFGTKSVRPCEGQATLFQKLEAAPITGLIETRVDGHNWLFFSTVAFVYSWKDQEPTAVEVTAGSPLPGVIQNATLSAPATRYSWTQWGRFVAFTNGAVAGQFYIQPPFTTLTVFGPGGPAVTKTPKVLIAFRNHLVGMGYPEEPAGIHWCSRDDLLTWTPTAINTAGDLQARELEGEIVAALHLGEGLAIYGPSTMHMLSFVGDPLVMGERLLQRNVGCVGLHALAAQGRVHYGFGPRGLWRTDGAQTQYIDQPSIHDFVFENLNREQWSKVLVCNNVTEETIEFHYPSLGSLENDRAVCFNYRNETWTFKEFARNAASSAEVFSSPIFGDSKGNIFMQSIDVDTAAKAAGVALAIAETWLHDNLYGMGGYGMGGYGGGWNGG